MAGADGPPEPYGWDTRARMGHPIGWGTRSVRSQRFPDLCSPLPSVGTASGFFLFAVALDVDFVAALQLNRWSLLPGDGQLADGAHLRLLSLFPHEKDSFALAVGIASRTPLVCDSDRLGFSAERRRKYGCTVPAEVKVPALAAKKAAGMGHTIRYGARAEPGDLSRPSLSHLDQKAPGTLSSSGTLR